MAARTPAQQAADAVAALRFVHSADLAPDGRSVAWCRTRIEGDDESIDLVVTVVGGPGDESLVLEGRSTHPEYSPDGREVAYLHDAGQGAQVAVLDLASRRMRTLTDLAQGVATGPRWSPDGTMIAFTAGPTPVDRSRPYRVTRAIAWRDGIGLVDDAINDVYVVDTGSLELTRLTDGDRLVGSLQWHAGSADLSYVAVAGQDDRRHDGRVCSVDLTGRTREIARLADIFSIAVHGDDLVGTSTGTSVNSEDTLGRLFAIDGTGTTSVRSRELDVNGDVIPDMPIPFTDPFPVLLLHGDDALVRAQVGDRLEIHRVGLLGEPFTEVEVSTTGSVYPLAVRGDHLLYGSGDRLTAPDLWVRDLTTSADTRVTHTAVANAERLTPLRVEHLWAAAEDGAAIQCAFLAPRASTGALPTVLLIHGGPEAAFGEALFLDAQVLCEAGLGVLLVNARGSRGYGADHQSGSRGDWGGVDAGDFMTAVDLAVERGLADPDRLGVSGLSYGGFMTTWLIGHTDRFRAAVAENPVTNFVSLYGTSDIGREFTPRVMGGPIDRAFDQYVASSPVTYAEHVTTPTLLIVSEQDHRCPPEQSLQFYSRLRSNGCEAELLMLPGASHAGAVSERPVVRRAQNEALVDWLATRLLDAPTAHPTPRSTKGQA